jgi:hypothetical protein
MSEPVGKVQAPYGFCRFGGLGNCPFGVSCVYKHTDQSGAQKLDPPRIPDSRFSGGKGAGKGKGSVVKAEVE